MHALEEKEEQRSEERCWRNVVDFRESRVVVAEQEPKPQEKEPKGGVKSILLCGELKSLLQ